MGNWKAVRLKKDAPLELYDLPDDPYEQRDVAAENPEVVAKIEQYLKTARTESSRWPDKWASERSRADGNHERGRRRRAQDGAIGARATELPTFLPRFEPTPTEPERPSWHSSTQSPRFRVRSSGLRSRIW